MTKSKILMAVSVGLLVGVGVGSVFVPPPKVVFALSALATLWLGIRAYYYSFTITIDSTVSSASFPVITHNLYFTILVLPWFLLGTGLGLWRIQTTLATPNQFVSWLGAKQDFEGVIVTEPDVRQDKQLLTVEPRGFSQRVLVTTTLTSGYEYGDEVWVRGKVVEPAVFDDFDYPGYLARFNTFALIRYPRIITLGSGQGNMVVSSLLKFKGIAVRQLLKLYDTTQGNFLLGILIGAKRGLPPEVTNNFIRTGTSHVVAASGYNIGILLTGLAFLAYAIGRRAQLVVSLLCILAFVVIAGPTASVVRATGMGLLVMLAIASARYYNPLPSLLCVASLMVWRNPRILYWDIGFQLSALATAGIVFGMPLVGHYKDTLGVWYKALALLGVTMCAILATLPVSLWHFGRFSVVAPLANLLIVPLVGPVMALGGLSFLPWIGAGIAWINSGLLWYMLRVVKVLAEPKWASWEWRISGSSVLVAYVVLLFAYILLRRRFATKHIEPQIPNIK